MTLRAVAHTCSCCLLLTLLAGCGGGSSDSTPPPAPTPTPTPTPAAKLTVTTTSLPTAYAGTPYSAQLAAANGTAPYTWTSNGVPDLAFSSAGLISGTPQSGGCNFPVSVTVKDSSSPQQTATANLPFTTIQLVNELQTGQVNVYFHGSFTLVCAPEPITWSVVSGTLPAGLSASIFPGDDSQFDFPGSPTQSGSFPVTVQSTDGTGHVIQLGATVIILPVALTSSDSANLHAIVNQPYTHAVVATGGTTPYSFNTPPARSPPA